MRVGKDWFFVVLQLLFMVVIFVSGLELMTMAYLHLSSEGSQDPKSQIRQTLEIGDKQIRQVSARNQMPVWMRKHVLHPYMGFVRDYDLSPTNFAGRIVDLPINIFGLFGDAPPLVKSDDEYVVAVTGGSVAAELFIDARGVLQQELQRIPSTKGKSVRIVSIAVEGWKQPQQLMALNYFLTIGAHFDMLINLDGFNEVALPFSDNIPFNVFPFYPRNWRLHASTAISTSDAITLGQIADTHNRLQYWREQLSNSKLINSYFFLAVWRYYNQRATNNLYALDKELRAGLQQAGGLGAQEKGPSWSIKEERETFESLATFWERSSMQLAALCQANGIAYFHFLQPNQYLSGSKQLTEWERRNAFSASPKNQRKRAVRAGYPLLSKSGERLQESGLKFFDLTMAFENEPENIYKDACCHYNKYGSEFIARLMVTLIGGTKAQ